MSTADGIPTGDELARHARWIRRMAGALLRDEAAAEDLAQDTWLASLTRAPRSGSLRPWLREVARNFARKHHRGKARRAAREEAAHAPSQPEAPDEFAARLETEQRLTRELAALDEPFRSSLMLRYYEELEPAEIAARLGLPGGTVRWRLSRGLALLRERLDRAHGGDRRAWSLALAPLARLDLAAGAATLGAAALVPGFLAMNALKLSVAAAAVLVVGLSLSGVLPDSLSPFARRETPLAVGFKPLTLQAAEVQERATEAPAAGVEAERVELAGTETETLVAAVAPLGEATLDARFSVRDRPLLGARLVVRQRDGVREGVSDAPEGLASVSFPLAEARALVRFELTALGYASEERSAVCAAGETTHLGQIELVPGGAVSGRVVDERGVPLSGARLSLGSLDDPYPMLEMLRLEVAEDVVPTCTSGADGRFFLAGVPSGMVRLWA
ncbi:MAG: sigma-70 family RNA polymerase sigma factor, partial [Planctomycetota bacterium]